MLLEYLLMFRESFGEELTILQPLLKPIWWWIYSLWVLMTSNALFVGLVSYPISRTFVPLTYILSEPWPWASISR